MTVFKAVLVGGAALALSGCAGLHLYSPSRDQQGQAAQKAWKDADALAPIQAERDNTATVLAEQLAYLADASVVSRDKKLAAVVFSQSSVSDELQVPAKAALQALIGGDKLADDFIKAQRDERVYEAEYAETMTHLAAWGFEPFSCSDLTTGKADSVVADLLTSLKTQNAAGADDLQQAILRSASFCTSPKRTAVRTYVQHAVAAASSPETAPRLFAQMSTLYAMEDAGPASTCIGPQRVPSRAQAV